MTDVTPIRSPADHAAALRDVSRLWGAPVGTPEGDRLDVLVTLIDAYEDATIEIATSDPVEILNYAISEMGHKQAELARLLGSRSRASEVLARKRRLSVSQIAKICAAWRLPADILVQPYTLAKRIAAKGGSRKQATRRRSAPKRAA